MIEIGIVGTGGIAQKHGEAVAALGPLARLRAVTDTDGERARAFAARFGAEKVYPDHRELVADPSISMVFVCSPNSTHAAISIDALAAGKAVLCEKPIAGSLAELDEIAAAQKRYGGIISSVFGWRYGEGLLAFRELLSSGIAGRILWAQANVLWRRTEEYYASGPWRGRWATERGGPLMTLAIHAIDAVAGIMPPAVSASAYIANYIHDVEVEDASASILRFEDGAIASLNVTSANHENYSRVQFICEGLEAASHTAAYTTADMPWSFVSAEPVIQARIDEIVRSRAGAHGASQAGEPNAHLLQIRDFVQRASRGENPPVSLAEARKSLEMIAGIYKAGFTGGMVDLPIGPEDPFYRDMNGGQTLSRVWSRRKPG